MKTNKILIAGATGFVGKNLIDYLLSKGFFVNALTRKKQLDKIENLSYFQWDISKSYIDENAFKDVDTIINLTGANIGKKRWTKQRKQELVVSRIEAINLLFDTVVNTKTPITTFISSSAVGYYGATTTSETFTEESSKGIDFLAEVCEKWEESAMQFKKLNIRTVILRKGVIIGKGGGIYQKLAPLAKYGINTALGNGRQFLPWMDIRDLVRLYEFFINNSTLSGVYNAVASEHITMNEFSKALLQSFGKRSFLPNVPKFIIQLVFGELSKMLLEGSKISNEKLKSTQFIFEHEKLENSLRFE